MKSLSSALSYSTAMSNALDRINSNPPPRLPPAAPDEVYIALKADPAGGWGGPAFWQKCRADDPGAVRYVREGN